MRDRSVMPVRDQRGQSFVLVIFSLFGLVMVLALVVDVGMWLRAQRHAQSVADSAALAGAQELPDSRDARDVAEAYARWNWPEADVSSSRDPSSIEVVVRADVPGLFSRLVGILDVRVSAKARAEVDPPASIRGVTPIAIECDRSPNCRPWQINGRNVRFRYRERSGNNSFSPITLPGIRRDEFSTYLACDATELGDSCYSNYIGPATYGILDLSEDGDRRPDELCAELAAAGTMPRIVAVFDSFDSTADTFDVVGFAVFTFQLAGSGGSGRCSGMTVDIEGTFQRYLVSGSRMTSDRSGGVDFGVRAVALTE